MKIKQWKMDARTYFWYAIFDCDKCGKETTAALDETRLASGLCPTCYYDKKTVANENTEAGK